MNDLIANIKNIKQITAIIDWIVIAAGRSKTSPPSILKNLIKPPTVPPNPRSIITAAPCIACLKYFSLRASKPKISTGIPRNAGMSAVTLSLPIPK